MYRSTAGMTTQSRETIGDVPPGLQGASTTVAGSMLYLFGGSLASTSELRLLSTLFTLDLELWKWEKMAPTIEAPEARYFHTADIWKNYLVVFGGLGDRDGSVEPVLLRVLNDVRLFDLSTRRWLPPPRVRAVSPLKYVPRPRHSHLSCVSSDYLFVIGGKDLDGKDVEDVCVFDLARKEWIQTQPHSPTFDMNHVFASTSRWHVRAPPPDSPSGKSVEPKPLPYSEEATNTSPHDMYIYNCDRLQRTLHVLSPLSNGEFQTKSPSTGRLPWLRFPSGGILGNTLIVSGTCVENDNPRPGFFLWTLDLVTSAWSRVDTGESLNKGTWVQGCLSHAQNKFIIFKARAGNIGSTRPLIPGWKEVAVVDLEALGIYQPPVLQLDVGGQRLGLGSLADTGMADFNFLCDDGRRIPCSRKFITERWPWFAEQQDRLNTGVASIKYGKRVEITVTATSCSLSQSYPVTMALLQYFYTMALGTALQRAPAVLSYLLLISTEFSIPHLQALVKHAMHLALSGATAAGVYEIAASCGCRSLQIR
ncbi:galactose oxidase [Mycena galericulata]|nr:galactose oxidase [Mycena galericulata]